MKNGYTKNYIKIYFWRSISILSGFLTLFVVVPHLSNNLELYGVYSFCISFTLYLSYADIGFLNAGQKYAAEAFARGDKKGEIEVLGFTGAILLLMVIPFSVGMIFLSFSPELLISDLSLQGRQTASQLFLILGVVLPFQIILQRLVQSILIIRIKDYISLRIDVVANLIKILSVFCFFTSNNYFIVEYYLFISLVTLLSAFIILLVIRKSENYDFVSLLKSIKLSKKVYNKVKKLTFSSFFMTVGWLIYYEFDLIIIGNWFGAEQVAIYAIGFTFLNFLRTLWNTVFSPFAQRFNHFVGTDSNEALQNMINKLIEYTFPLCIIVTTILILISKELTLFWVGEEFTDSILILQVLILGTGFSFITKPASYYFVAKTKYRYMNAMAGILPVVFLISLVIISSSYGLLGVALSKTLAMFLGLIISLIGIHEFKPLTSIKKSVIPVTLLVLILVYFVPIILEFFFTEFYKSSIMLLELLVLSGTLIVVFYGISLMSNAAIRKEINENLTKWMHKRNSRKV